MTKPYAYVFDYDGLRMEEYFATRSEALLRLLHAQNDDREVPHSIVLRDETGKKKQVEYVGAGVQEHE